MGTKIASMSAVPKAKPVDEKGLDPDYAVELIRDDKVIVRMNRGQFRVPVLFKSGHWLVALLDSCATASTMHPDDARMIGIFTDTPKQQLIGDYKDDFQLTEGRLSEEVEFQLTSGGDTGSNTYLRTRFFIHEKAALKGRPLLGGNTCRILSLLGGIPAVSIRLRPRNLEEADDSVHGMFEAKEDAELKEQITKHPRFAALRKENEALAGRIDPKVLTVYIPFKKDFNTGVPTRANNYHANNPKDKQMQEALKAGLTKWINEGVVEETDKSRAMCLQRLLIVRQKNKFRLCLDAVHINSVSDTIKQTLPRFEDAVAKMRGGKVFITIDGKSLYNQAVVYEGHTHHLAFEAFGKCYRFVRCPFGLAHAPGLFQGLAEDLARDIEGCQPYIDDIAFAGDSVEDVVRKVCVFMERANAIGWTINWDKATLGATSIKFLGSIVNADGVSLDPSKLEALAGMERPTTLRGMQSFIGFINFLRRHVRDFAVKIEPLQRMVVEGRKKLEWTAEGREAFTMIKESLRTGAFLHAFDPAVPLTMWTDASDAGIGVVVAQKAVNGLGYNLVGFDSRTLTASELLYSAYKREALAVVWALRKWRRHIRDKVDLFTDNAGLAFVVENGESERLPVSWLDELARQELKLTWCPGQDNAFADYLSRHAGEPNARPSLSDLMEVVGGEGDELAAIAGVSGVMDQNADGVRRAVIKSLRATAPGAVDAKVGASVHRRTEVGAASQEEVPAEKVKAMADRQARSRAHAQRTEQRRQATTMEQARLAAQGEMVEKENKKEVQDDSSDTLQDLVALSDGMFRPKAHLSYKQGPIPGTLEPDAEHRSQLVADVHRRMGHRGAPSMLWLLRAVMRLSWDKMRDDCYDYATKCTECQVHNPGKSGNFPARYVDPVCPMHRLYVDMKGPLVESDDGYNNILIIVDQFTSYTWLRPVRDVRASTVLVELLTIFRQFGYPYHVHGDSAAYFKSQEFVGLLAKHGTEARFSAAGHQSSNGVVENKIGTVKRTITKMLADHKQSATRWIEWVGAVQEMVNAARSRVSGASPFALMFGRPFHDGVAAAEAATIPAEEKLDAATWAATAAGDDETQKDWLLWLNKHFEEVIPAVRQRILERHAEQAKVINRTRFFGKPVKVGDYVRIRGRDSGDLPGHWSEVVYRVEGVDGEGNHVLSASGRRYPHTISRRDLKWVRQPYEDSVVGEDGDNRQIKAIVEKLPSENGKEYYMVSKVGTDELFKVGADLLDKRRRNAFEKKLAKTAKLQAALAVGTNKAEVVVSDPAGGPAGEQGTEAGDGSGDVRHGLITDAAQKQRGGRRKRNGA